MILDDPALGLDPISRKQFNRDVIEHLQGEGRTVFYSSHLLYEVEPLADVVAILDAGRMIRVSPVEELQRDVKRVILSAETLAHCPPPEKLLDVGPRRRPLVDRRRRGRKLDCQPARRRLRGGGGRLEPG